MAKTIATQYGEFLNYDNLVRIGVITNWEDAEPDENGIITPDYEMIGTDTSGNQIPMGNYKTPEAAEAALKDLYLGDADHIGGAGNSHRHACGDHHQVPVLHNDLLCGQHIIFIIAGVCFHVFGSVCIAI